MRIIPPALLTYLRKARQVRDLDYDARLKLGISSAGFIYQAFGKGPIQLFYSPGMQQYFIRVAAGEYVPCDHHGRPETVIIYETQTEEE